MHLNVVLFCGSGVRINQILWKMIKENDQITIKKKKRFKARRDERGMAPIASPRLVVNGSEIAIGYERIRSYLLGLNGLSLAVMPQKNLAVEQLIAVPA